MKNSGFVFLLVAILATFPLAAQEPIEIGFLWHMHQPTYRPGETILQTENSGAFSFSIVDVHNQRFGPYTGWPRDAIQSGQGLPNLGASVSFSGSLIRNLDTLSAAGVNGGQWNSWFGAYRQATGWQTSEGNSRLDLVNFGFNHPLMALLDKRDIQMQVRLQRHQMQSTFPGVTSKGIFPPETAFSTRMIPALVEEGIEWAIVDSIHIERATIGYPHVLESGLFPPNAADQINPGVAGTGSQWVNLNGLWAPSAVAAPFGYRPHFAQHVDPETGDISRMVVVPGARYEGNEDGRGGFGALQYEAVMEQYRGLNTDPDHPMFVLLHHDGDNFGGGSESYYHGNFNNMVSWASSNSNYNVSTVQDYLDRFPVDPLDVVHVEDGSWAGADNGDPEFKKWLGDPGADGFSPDRNSWAVLTAARNRVFTADDISPVSNLDNVIAGQGSQTERAWHTLLQAEGSDHWYWDGEEVWDSNVTRGSNLAVQNADQVIGSFSGTETTPPTIFVPQRDPFNPGGFEFGNTPESSDFEVWTYAYDVSGLESVKLYYRTDIDGMNPLSSIQNETYAGGNEVGDWIEVPMVSSDVSPPPGILSATYRALKYSAEVVGIQNTLVDYYVEAIDLNGVVAKTDIQHVYVGDASTTGTDRVVLVPSPPIAGDLVTIEYESTGGPLAGSSEVYLHYGINDWAFVFEDVPMSFDGTTGVWSASVLIPESAGLLDVVFNDGAGTWDNNNGQDWHFVVEGTVGNPFEMDGQLDEGVKSIASNNSQSLYYSVSSSGQLYLATEDAGDGNDVFIYLAENPGPLVPANWAKAGMVAEWDGFLADENDNDFHSWFGINGESATGADGGVLEGVVDLEAIYGVRPDSIWIAVGCFETSDGSGLVNECQVPASLDDDGNIQAIEWIEIDLVESIELVTQTIEVSRGAYVQGELSDVQASDNVDFSARRNTNDVQSKVELVGSTTSPFNSLSEIQLVVESSVFARSTVELSVDLYDFSNGQWIEIASGLASRLVDSVLVAQETTSVGRFMEMGSNRIEFRIRYRSLSQRQRFSANVDQIKLTLKN